MGQTLSTGRYAGGQEGPRGSGVGSSLHVQRRIELLEELCTAGEPARRVEVLQQLSVGQGAGCSPLDGGRVLPTAPPEFRPGRLIAAGCAGRVYEGTYCGEPAALKVLILDEDTAHEILNEVRLCLKLQHRNLVQLLDCAVVATSRSTALTTPAASPAAAAGGGGDHYGGHHHADQQQHQRHLQLVDGPGISALQLGGSASASAQQGYSYLLVVPLLQQPQQQQLPAALDVDAAAVPPPPPHLLPPGAFGAAGDGGRGALMMPHASAPSPLSGACFEVWIAMELCDGGTLSEQLRQGFLGQPGSGQVDMEQLLLIALDVARALCYMHSENVCHGDLKAENVLLKTRPSSSGQLNASVSGASSSSGGGQNDCTMLCLLCSTTSGSNTCTCGRSRRMSADSCWSCYTKGGSLWCTDSPRSSSSLDEAGTLSSSGSNASTPVHERRSSRSSSGRRSRPLLTGLCCISPAQSCVTHEDESPDASGSGRQRAAAALCFGCGCGAVSTLEPSQRACAADSGADGGGSSSPAKVPDASLLQQAQQQDGAAGQPAAGAAGAASAAEHCQPQQQQQLDVVPLVHVGTAAASRGTLCWPDVQGAAAAPAAAVPLHCQPLLLGGMMFAPGAALSEQPAGQLPHSAGPAAQLRAGAVPPHDSEALFSEEEHIAPLSLYAQARERRRSRCLPHGVLLPAAFAAVAAAAGSSGSSADQGFGSAAGSGGGDDESGPSVPSSLVAAGAAGAASPLGSPPDDAAGQPDAPEGSGGGAGSGAAAAAPAGCSGHAAPGVPSHVDVYALSAATRLPRRSRVRRHSYCYGNTSSYTALLAGAKQGGATAAGGGAGSSISSSFLSAAEVAAAIAAAADGVSGRADSQQRAAAAGEAGSRRPRHRRMSWDDHMLCSQQPPARGALSGLLGSVLPGLGRAQGGAAEAAPLLLGMSMQDSVAAAAGASSSSGGGAPARQHRARRHSWACHAQPDQLVAAAPMSAVAAGMTSLARTQSAAPAGQALEAPSGRRGRARRHSWAAHGGSSYGSRLRALSSCFAGSAGDLQQACGSRQPRLSPLPDEGCWGSEGDRTTPSDLWLPAAEELRMRQGLLDDAAGPSSSSGAGLARSVSELLLLMQRCDNAGGSSAGGGSFFGRLCSGSIAGSACASDVSSSPRVRVPRRSRRSSWCCGGTAEADLWAAAQGDGDGGEAALALLSACKPLSVQLPPQRGGADGGFLGPPQRSACRQGRRERRASLDSLSWQRSTVAGQRQAASLDVRVGTPDSWRSSSSIMPPVMPRRHQGTWQPDARTPGPGGNSVISSSSLRSALDACGTSGGAQPQEQAAAQASPAACDGAQPLARCTPAPAPAAEAARPVREQTGPCGAAAAVAAVQQADASARTQQHAPQLLVVSPPGQQQQQQEDLFTGSFPLSTLACHGPAQAHGATDARPAGGGRGRRWSTGVPAQQLLLRVQSLSSGQEGVGDAPAAEPAPPAHDDGGAASLPLPSPAVVSTAAAAATAAAPGGAAHNVLGMPPKPAAPLSQRRMSYDTATGVYHLVAAMQAASEAEQQQQQQQQAASAPSAEQQQQLLQLQDGPATAAGLPPNWQAAYQQQYQQQMQRLVDALARRGYPASELQSEASTPLTGAAAAADGAAAASAAGSAGAGAALAPAAAAAAAQQQQQQGVLAPYAVPFTAKVCDFGFSKSLRAGQSHCSTGAAGTLTHQAPEVLRHGRLSPAADVYALGILLWELATRQRPFQGLLEGDLVVGVCDRGLRPVFPASCPPPYAALAQQCWAEDPAQRPTMGQVLRRLNELLYQERRARLKANAAAAGSSGSGGGNPAAAAAAQQQAACRRRRHSMPLVGGVDGRQRRRSRRFSLFLLPFTRPPAVPEDAPLVDCPACPHHDSATGASTAAALRGQQQARPGGSSSSGSGGLLSAAGAGSSGSHAVAQHAFVRGASLDGAAAGASCSSSHAAVSTGGLLTSGSAPGRLRGSGSGAAAPAGDVTDSNEWFQSF